MCTRCGIEKATTKFDDHVIWCDSCTSTVKFYLTLQHLQMRALQNDIGFDNDYSNYK